MKLLFCVHRYAPYPGGSEIYVQAMAEESLRRGHQVSVFAGTHMGDLNGVNVTDNPGILLGSWDLIIVHGGDVNIQNFVLTNIKQIPSPVLYMLILPSHSAACLQGLRDCAYVGYSTQQDIDHCKTHNVWNKAVQIRHGINYFNCIGQPGFKAKHNITQRMFLSCGGYWPNKAMKELAEVFERANLADSILVTTGYDNSYNLMPTQTDCVKPMLINDRQEVLSAMRDADCLLMHSYSEGFGLVLLESMLNQTPWIARNIAGANLMQKYGQVYDTDEQLLLLLKNFSTADFNLEQNYNFAQSTHMIWHTVDDIESCAKQKKFKNL